ncbi:MAG: DUF742 domain-containing protein [Pseudonocardia sp.]
MSPEQYPGPAIGLTGARFGNARRSKPPKKPKTTTAETVPTTAEPAPGNVAAAPPAAETALPVVAGTGPDADPEPVDPTSSSFVRPYVLTGGRTRSRFELSIETLVSAVPMAPVRHHAVEHRAVVTLCREVRSVAEVAVLLGVPLGVARVLLGDLAATGAIAVHATARAAGPDLALMERVLSGLRRL